MMRFISVIVALVIGTVASAAQPTLYDCDITKRDKDVGWISPKVVVIMQADGSVLVSDSVILWHVEEPIPARARTRGDRLIVQWTLSGMVDAAQQIVPKFNYRATIDTADNSIVLRAKPVGFPQGWTGRGSCKLRNK